MPRYGGLKNGATQPLAQCSPEQLRKAIYGCTVGLRLAWDEGDLEDVDVMLERINTLAMELAGRVSR
ncbi:MAG: hypothetical protein ACOCTI_05245 [Phycisphaeraceae bacterium]